jgi:hypothetical protein
MSIVLYTARYGQAEPLNPGVFGPAAGVRRVLFTDDPAARIEGAETIVDPLDGLDPARASRRAKLRPHAWFPDAEWSIWLDNKSRLLAEPERIVAALKAQSDAGFFAFPHFRRDCVYQEGQAVWENGLDDHRIVKARLAQYRAEGFPEHAGLIEGHFIVRRHNDPGVAHFGDRWFEHVLRFSRRDQISFPYLARATGLRYDFITALNRPETVQLTVFDRKARTPDFRRHNLLYQRLRAAWHQARRR